MNVRSIALVGVVALTCAACDTALSSLGMSAGSGVVAVRLTDTPFPSDSVKSVDVYVVRVDARVAAADSTAAADGAADDSASVGGWTTIARPDTLIDLLSLQNGITKGLGAATLAAANYDGFRLIIDPSRSSVTLANGTVLTGTSSPKVTFPSASRTGIKIDLTQPITITANDTTPVLVDFNVASSFVVPGTSVSQSGLLFTPVVTATQK